METPTENAGSADTKLLSISQGSESMGVYEEALKYWGMGFNVIPLWYGEKKPILSSWQEFQERRMTEEEVKKFFSGEEKNIGIVCGPTSGNLVAVDFDDMEVYAKATESGFLSETTLTHKSGKGVHKLYRLDKPCGCFRIDKLKIDVKGNGGYVVAPPSWHTKAARRYARIGELMEPRHVETDDFKSHLLDTLEKIFEIDLTLQKDVINIENIMRGVEQGSRDESAIHLATWFRKCGLDEEKTAIKMLEWDRNNKPPLGEKLVRDKVKSAFKPAEPYHFIFSEEPLRPDVEWLKEINTICYDKLPGKVGRLQDLFVRWILSSHNFHFLTMMDTEEIYIYEGGIYVPRGEQKVKEFIQRKMNETANGEWAKTNLVYEVVNSIKRSTYIERSELGNNLNLICVQNGVLNIDTLEFSEHSPEYKFVAKIPVDYDYKADCPAFKKFLANVLPEKDGQIIQELFGYCLYRRYPVQKAFMFTGSGQNGKSVLLSALKRFLGPANTVSISIQDLEANQFSKSRLYGKMANIYPDLSDKALDHTGIFKALTGGDSLTADKKFKDAIEFENYAKLIFSANKLPEANDDTDAFHRRWIILIFSQTFSKEKGNLDTTILDKITTKEELSGILNWSLEGLKRLLAEQSFSFNASIDDMRSLYTQLSDSLAAFIDAHIDTGYDGEIEKEQFYSDYAAYCRTNKLFLKTKPKVGRDLPKLITVFSGKGMHNRHTWKGIRFRGLEQPPS
jgi:putative DNA primase/helicase